ncbi:MAG: DUF5666 domain-containing protein, partial [Nitrososphaerota archaeon]
HPKCVPVKRKWWVIVLGKAALLMKSKVAIAVLGVLVAGTGSTVALAATGHMPALPTQATATPSAHDNSNNSNHGHTVGIEGTLKAYNAGAKTISVQAKSDTSATTIHVNDQTRVNGANASKLSDLTANVGHKVQVQADKQSNGSLLAWKITVEGATDDHGSASDNQHDVAGTVTSVSAHGFVVKTATGTTITVATNAQTTFRGAAIGLAKIKTGMHVEVHGTSQSDGSILASSVQVEDGQGTGQSSDHNSGH